MKKTKNKEKKNGGRPFGDDELDATLLARLGAAQVEQDDGHAGELELPVGDETVGAAAGLELHAGAQAHVRLAGETVQAHQTLGGAHVQVGHRRAHVHLPRRTVSASNRRKGESSTAERGRNDISAPVLSIQGSTGPPR